MFRSPCESKSNSQNSEGIISGNIFGFVSVLIGRQVCHVFSFLSYHLQTLFLYKFMAFLLLAESLRKSLTVVPMNEAMNEY